MRKMADRHITSNSAKRNARNNEEMLVSEQQDSYLSEHGINTENVETSEQERP